jgi:glycosyltransferase involved in cell wall biosynthesis
MTMRVVLVVGTTSGGIGTHVRMLAVGLAAQRHGVLVVGPSSADARFGFSALPGVAFAPVEFGDRPRPADVAAVVRLRQVLRHVGADFGASGAGAARPCPQVLHAHGLRAGALCVLALAGVRAWRRPELVVTVHNAPPAGGGATALVYRALERLVARGADLVLCVSPDLEARARDAGARRVDRAVVPAADRPESGAAEGTPGSIAGAGGGEIAGAGGGESARPASGEAEQHVTAGAVGLGFTGGSEAADAIGSALARERPMVLAVGRLAGQKGFGTLLEAAAGWRHLAPPPLLVIAGDGPLAGELRARAATLGVDVAFAGHRDDVPALLRAAAVFVLPSRWEGQPLVLQEALRAGAAIAATRVGGVPALTGEDAAVLVPPDDPAQLAAAVRSVLTDRPLASRLRAAALARAATLPSEADAISAVLAAYAAAGAERRK